MLHHTAGIRNAADWKGRFKQNLDRMKSGRLTDIADVLKSLNWVQKQRSLSFRERKMYERARYLIVSEIAEVNGRSESEIDVEVDEAEGPVGHLSERRRDPARMEGEAVVKRREITGHLVVTASQRARLPMRAIDRRLTPSTVSQMR